MTYGVGRIIPVYCYSDSTAKEAGNNSTTPVVSPDTKYINFPRDLQESHSIEITIAGTEWIAGKDADLSVSIRTDAGAALSTPFKLDFTVSYTVALDGVQVTSKASSDLVALAATNQLSAQRWLACVNAAQIRVRNFLTRVVVRRP